MCLCLLLVFYVYWRWGWGYEIGTRIGIGIWTFVRGCTLTCGLHSALVGALAVFCSKLRVVVIVLWIFWMSCSISVGKHVHGLGVTLSWEIEERGLQMQAVMYICVMDNEILLYNINLICIGRVWFDVM